MTSSKVSDNGCNGSVSYQYCRNTSNSTSSCTASSWLSTTGTTFESLSDGQIYYYFVRAKDGL